MADCRRVKPIVLLIALACPLEAALLAIFQTSRGNVTAELEFATAPRAVANFITLAEGTRAWVDHADGRIRREPFYNGTKIHRTANSGSFQFAQGGSRAGDGSDGPGFTFKDEFHAAVTHTPYTLSMANSGPNTNGCQFFFTGALSQPSFDFVHSVLGRVTDPASRAVVDAMIASGPGATTIEAITFSRTDAAALAFDEHAQELPVVFQPDGGLEVIRNASATWRFARPMETGDVLTAYRSLTLTGGDWAELGSGAHAGIGPPSAIQEFSSVVLDDAAAPKAFYHLALARHPGAVAPSHPAGRTMLLDLDGDLFVYQFNAEGSGGVATINPGSPSEVVYSFNTLDFSSGAHHFVAITENLGLSAQYRYFLIKAGCDEATDSQVDGRHTILLHNGFGWAPFLSGAAAITR